MGWEMRIAPLADGGGSRGAVRKSGRTLSFAEVIALWRDDPAFRDAFAASLAASELGGFFWETPPVTTATLDRDFELVLIEGPMLERLEPDARPFAERFEAASEAVLTFPNLGGDAVLVVPAPLASDHAPYAHLAAFVRGAPPAQIDAFWAAAGEAMAARVSERPVWLSTAGLGVSWLHLRLDSRPKYYRHRPYRELQP